MSHVMPTAPLAVRMRPRSLDEVVGQQHLLRQGSPLRVLANEPEAGGGAISLILWDHPQALQIAVAAAEDPSDQGTTAATNRHTTILAVHSTSSTFPTNSRIASTTSRPTTATNASSVTV